MGWFTKKEQSAAEKMNDLKADVDKLPASLQATLKENKTESVGGSQVINEYTKMDPTLPRLYNLKCPNEDCKTNQQDAEDKNPEIIYIRVNDNDLKYVYLCNCCDFTWKTNENTI